LPFFKKKIEVIGYVEKIEHNFIEGWAIHKQNKNIVLEIEIEHKNYILSPSWLDRKDVSSHYGSEFQQAGFSCQLPPKIQNKLKYSVIKISDIRILANEVPLTIDTNVTQPLVEIKKSLPQELIEPGKVALPLQQENIEADKTENKNLSVEPYIQSWGHFLILGQFNNKNSEIKADSLTLSCNGKKIECSIVVSQEELSGNITEKGSFQIELPGYIWECDAGELEIDIQLNTKKLLINSLVLTKKKAITWLEDISSL